VDPFSARSSAAAGSISWRTVALRVLALRATQAHQERLNKHLRRIIRACGTHLADQTEFARLIRSACVHLPTDLRAALHIVADAGNM
jgi:alkylhydroperoxidase/carboxymuconolactone decarboxylase family protein YurZ